MYICSNDAMCMTAKISILQSVDFQYNFTFEGNEGSNGIVTAEVKEGY